MLQYTQQYGTEKVLHWGCSARGDLSIALGAGPYMPFTYNKMSLHRMVCAGWGQARHGGCGKRAALQRATPLLIVEVQGRGVEYNLSSIA